MVFCKWRSRVKSLHKKQRGVEIAVIKEKEPKNSYNGNDGIYFLTYSCFIESEILLEVP
jgi:hypothetical protein